MTSDNLITAFHAKYYAYLLTRRHAANDVNRLSQSLFDASVDLNPHQIEAALFALRSPLSKGVLLADEVGLGKTIEAGIVLCQYWSERRRRLLVTVDSAGAYEERTIDLIETFNYLLGLRVKHIDIQLDEGFALVTGKLPTGEKTLIFWRDCEKIDYDFLWQEQDLLGKERAKSVLGKLDFNPRDTEFEVIYINGDHNIPDKFTPTEADGGITKTLKIRQIEPEFLSKMFATETV